MIRYIYKFGYGLGSAIYTAIESMLCILWGCMLCWGKDSLLHKYFSMIYVWNGKLGQVCISFDGCFEDENECIGSIFFFLNKVGS